MVRTFAKVLAADAVLLAAEYFALQDLGFRSAYAASKGFTPSYSYSIFTQFFTMLGRGLTLESPPTLDWVQLLFALLVALNLQYLYRITRMRARNPASDAGSGSVR